MALANGTRNEIRRVLILGDNHIATSITRALSKAALEVHVAAPYENSTPDENVAHHVSNLTADSLRALFADVEPDLLISTVSGGSCETQKRIINCAIGTGVLRFIPAEFGQDSLNEKIQQRLPPNGERARVIKHLEELASRGYLSWVAVAIGTALDRGLLSGNLGFDLKWQSATLHGQGDESFPASSVAWIGRVVLAVIQHWDDVKNRYLYASGTVTTADDIVASFEKSTGKTWEVGRAEVDQCVREAEKRIEMGFPDAGMFLMERSVLYDTGLGAAESFTSKDAKSKLGLEGEKLDDIIKDVVHEHDHHGGGKADCGCD